MRFIALGLLLSLLLFGCRQSNIQTSDHDIDIQLQLDSDVTQVGETTLRIQVQAADGSPVDDATVQVRGDMSHAGMVPVIREVRGGTNGEYEVPFEWTMAGDWFIEVTVTLPDGEPITERFAVDGVKDG